MKKQTIKLTEAKLRDMIKKAVHESIYEGSEDEDKKYETQRKIYQHCCDCQDLSESIGDWELFDTFEGLRRLLNRKMYG